MLRAQSCYQIHQPCLCLLCSRSPLPVTSDILDTFLIPLLLRESRPRHSVQLHRIPQPLQLFLRAVSELFISYHLLPVTSIQTDKYISEWQHWCGFSKSGLIFSDAFQEVFSRANKLVFLISLDVLQLQFPLPAIFPSLRVLKEPSRFS